MRALANVWKPAAGAVRLDGMALEQWPDDQLGQYIGYVTQDVELLDGTIGENISRFDENPDPEKIVRAARQAHAHELIGAIGGYDRQLGPDGKNLSSGQRQRIALARALYGEPALIILDEPYSNLDGAGEKAIFAAIAGMRERGQTVIIVAHMHRTRIIDRADKILALKEGRQILFGPRKEVLAKLRSLNGARPAGKSRAERGEGADSPKQPKPPFHIVSGGGG
jgi:ATP-binding cassette subfamily C protein